MATSTKSLKALAYTASSCANKEAAKTLPPTKLMSKERDVRNTVLDITFLDLGANLCTT